jgi:hypothetical protein
MMRWLSSILVVAYLRSSGGMDGVETALITCMEVLGAMLIVSVLSTLYQLLLHVTR